MPEPALLKRTDVRDLKAEALSLQHLMNSSSKEPTLLLMSEGEDAAEAHAGAKAL